MDERRPRGGIRSRRHPSLSRDHRSPVHARRRENASTETGTVAASGTDQDDLRALPRRIKIVHSRAESAISNVSLTTDITTLLAGCDMVTG
jgi:hypothetical protein